jgi:hypothetical protein
MMVVGKSEQQWTGLVPEATVATFAGMQLQSPPEMWLIALLRIIRHIEEDAEDREGRCVINISKSVHKRGYPQYDEFGRQLSKSITNIALVPLRFIS